MARAVNNEKAANPEDRTKLLVAERNRKMAASAHAYVRGRAWFRKCHFWVTPEIDRALMVEKVLVLGVTLI